MSVVTWNPSDKSPSITLADNNLSASTSVTSHVVVRATKSVTSGKYYWEVAITRFTSSVQAVGVGIDDVSDVGKYNFDNTFKSIMYYTSSAGGIYKNGHTPVASATGFTANDVIGVLLDMDSGTIEFRRNNSFIYKFTAVKSEVGINNAYPFLDLYACSARANFGNTPFVYPIPDGYRPYIYSAVYKYLFEDGTDIKKWDNTLTTPAWVVVGTSPVTQEMFDSYGMDEVALAAVNDAALKSLTSSTPKLLVWTDDLFLTHSIQLTAIPPAKLVLASGDIRLDYVENVDGFTVTANQTGNGVIRLIASVDGGVTWYTYSSGVWSVINHNDLAEVKANGIPPDVFNLIPSADWMVLIGTSKTIRFGYYLEIDTSTDVAATDRLTAQFDMLGSWDMAQPYVDFVYRYTNNSTVQVRLFNNGSYKINYQG